MVVFELLNEIERYGPDDLDSRLTRYAALDHDFIRLVGADRFPAPADSARFRRAIAMTGERLNEIFAAHFRCERAIAAARRFISRNTNARLARSDVVAFLRRRRDQLSATDIEYCATEAMERWLSSPAMRFRPRRARKRAIALPPRNDGGAQ